MPDLLNIFNFNPVAPKFTGLGGIILGLLNIIFSIAIFLAFYWLIWGAFQYIFASGDKNKLAQARGRITWALVGLFIIALAFLITQLAGQLLTPFKETTSPIPPII